MVARELQPLGLSEAVDRVVGGVPGLQMLGLSEAMI